MFNRLLKTCFALFYASGMFSQNENTLSILPPKTDILKIAAERTFLDCKKTSLLLRVENPLPDLPYIWTKPDGTQIEANYLQISSAGKYQVQASNSAETPEQVAEIIIEDRKIVPSLTAIGGTITCAQSVAEIHCAAFPANVILEWSGPHDFQFRGHLPQITEAGIYQVTATEPVSGCSASDTILVSKNMEIPHATANILVDEKISPEILLDGSNSSTGFAFIYRWWSEKGYPVESEDAAVTRTAFPDIYTLNVTNTLNGCSNSVRVKVEK